MRCKAERERLTLIDSIDILEEFFELAWILLFCGILAQKVCALKKD